MVGLVLERGLVLLLGVGHAEVLALQQREADLGELGGEWQEEGRAEALAHLLEGLGGCSDRVAVVVVLKVLHEQRRYLVDGQGQSQGSG